MTPAAEQLGRRGGRGLRVCAAEPGMQGGQSVGVATHRPAVGVVRWWRRRAGWSVQARLFWRGSRRDGRTVDESTVRAALPAAAVAASPAESARP